MEKIYKLFKIILIIILLLISYSCSEHIENNNYENELRLRIVANSNNEVDQAHKNTIKNYIWQLFNQNYDLNTYNIKEYLIKEINEEWVKDINIVITNDYYEAKSYDSRFIPSGNYKTLLITIGNGNGKNFWTILYPEFFNVSFEDNHEIEYHSYFYDIFKQ